MITIYKYQLEIADVQRVSMPAEARPLSVGFDHDGELCLWALVDTNKQMIDQAIAIVGTGRPCPSPPDLFVGTVKHPLRPNVRHVFFKGN